jgi:uncharacterized surface protein with fasciclin (FAS1) repeats
MKNTLNQVIMMAVAVSLGYGCASTESGIDITDTSAEKQILESETGSSTLPNPTSTGISAASKEMSSEPSQNLSIAALVQQDSKLSTFLELIRAADMVKVLESPVPYTVLIPTNKAFAALPPGTLEALKEPGNKTGLTRMIQAHMLPSRIGSEEMQDKMPLRTVQGEEVIIERDGSDIYVGGAHIVTPDVQASNGIVHVVDKVFLTPEK